MASPHLIAATSLANRLHKEINETTKGMCHEKHRHIPIFFIEINALSGLC
jgi:hypothetical protein